MTWKLARVAWLTDRLIRTPCASAGASRSFLVAATLADNGFGAGFVGVGAGVGSVAGGVVGVVGVWAGGTAGALIVTCSETVALSPRSSVAVSETV